MGRIAAAECDEAASGESSAGGVWRGGRAWRRMSGVAAG